MTGQNWWHPWCTNLRHCASVRILAYEANYTWFWCRTCSATYEHLLSVADWAWEPTFTTWDLGTYRCIPMLVILYTQPSHNCPFSPRDSRVDSLGPCRCINTRRTPMMWRSSTRRPGTANTAGTPGTSTVSQQWSGTACGAARDDPAQQGRSIGCSAYLGMAPEGGLSADRHRSPLTFWIDQRVPFWCLPMVARCFDRKDPWTSIKSCQICYCQMLSATEINKTPPLATEERKRLRQQNSNPEPPPRCSETAYSICWSATSCQADTGHARSDNRRARQERAWLAHCWLLGRNM